MSIHHLNIFSDRILSLNNIEIEKLLPEILKLLKLDNDKAMSVLEHPSGSGNVGNMIINRLAVNRDKP